MKIFLIIDCIVKVINFMINLILGLIFPNQFQIQLACSSNCHLACFLKHLIPFTLTLKAIITTKVATLASGPNYGRLIDFLNYNNKRMCFLLSIRSGKSEEGNRCG